METGEPGTPVELTLVDLIDLFGPTACVYFKPSECILTWFVYLNLFYRTLADEAVGPPSSVHSAGSRCGGEWAGGAAVRKGAASEGARGDK